MQQTSGQPYRREITWSVFDEKAKTVDFISLKNNSDAPIATYECTDEFTAEYDEDGLTSIMTSNVEYAIMKAVKGAFSPRARVEKADRSRCAPRRKRDPQRFDSVLSHKNMKERCA